MRATLITQQKQITVFVDNKLENIRNMESQQDTSLKPIILNVKTKFLLEECSHSFEFCLQI